MNVVQDTISCIVIIGAGLTLGYIGCAFVYASYFKTTDKSEIQKPLMKYKDRYPIDISGNYEEIQRMDTRYLSTVHEYTPNGGIFLKYDDENKEFHYWGSSGISYEVLCVVARKYCLVFNCPILYIRGFHDEKDNDISRNTIQISEEDQDLFLFKQSKKEPLKNKAKSKGDPQIQKLPKLSIKCVGGIDDYDIITGTSKSKPKYDSTEIVTWASFRQATKKNQ